MIKQLIESLPQAGQLVDKELSYQGIVDGCVAMNQDIPKSHDPPQFGDPGGSHRIYLRELVQSLTNNLKLALNRRPEFRVRLVVRE